MMMIDNVLFQRLAKHVMNLHMNAIQITAEHRPGEIDLETLKKFICYVRRYFQLLYHKSYI